MSKSVAIGTGAGQGIGRSTAIRLARDFSAAARGARPSISSKLAEVVRRAGAEALIIHADLTQTSAAQTVVDLTLAACPCPRAVARPISSTR